MAPAWRKWLGWILSGVGSAVIAASQVSVEQATSNLSGWLELLGLQQLPPVIANVPVDSWATIIGGTLIMIAVLMLGYGWVRKTMAKHFFRMSNIRLVSMGGNATGIKADAPIALDNVEIQFANAVDLKDGPGSRLDAKAIGSLAENSVGFDVSDSPGTDMSKSEATNYQTGYRVRGSPDSDLSGARARIEGPVKPDEEKS